MDNTFIDLFNKPVSLVKETDFKLSHSDYSNILDYLCLHIDNFNEDFVEALAKALDRTYDYELKLREFEDTFINLIRDKKSVALWGCGDSADKLFKKHKFLRDGSFYLIDKNTEKLGSYFWGREILPPSTITEKSIDTVIITSIVYADEIRYAITDRYPSVRYIIKLADLSVKIDIECIDLVAGAA